MSTCNRLDLQTLGSQPIMPQNLPDHCSNVISGVKTFKDFESRYYRLVNCVLHFPNARVYMDPTKL